MNSKINVVVVGAGNIGTFAINAIGLSKDMNLCGVIRRNPKPIPGIDVPVFSDVKEINEKIDVAVLCVPSRITAETASYYLKQGINTVDSFDIHSKILETKKNIEKVAKENNAVAIISAGWDPGSDSMIRSIFHAMVPSGITETNFGPGMSMGHSVAVKAIDGVVDAISMTIPKGSSIHRRVIYTQIENGADFNKIAESIKKDPYFINDECVVIKVDDIEEYRNAGHGVNLIRYGKSSGVNNQRLDFNMKIDNPALTAQIMIASARATMRQEAGCYTLIEIPPIDLLPGEKDDWIKKLV